jgi:hypothetical protein
MTNFLLVDAPDFVLRASSTDTASRWPFGEPAPLNPAFTEIIGLLGVNPEVDEPSGPLTFDGDSAVAMRRVMARYGFELPPLSVAELFGFFAYCDRLDALVGRGVLAPHQRPPWQAMCTALLSDGCSPDQRAVDAYGGGDAPALRRLHRERDTLAGLGRAYLALGA